jgi:hypothetical protein
MTWWVGGLLVGWVVAVGCVVALCAASRRVTVQEAHWCKCGEVYVTRVPRSEFGLHRSSVR